MIRDVVRDDDDVQVAELAAWRARRGARRARWVAALTVAAYVGAVVLSLAVITLAGVAWAATGDDRLGWVFAGLVVVILAAHLLVVNTRGGGEPR